MKWVIGSFDDIKLCEIYFAIWEVTVNSSANADIKCYHVITIKKN